MTKDTKAKPRRVRVDGALNRGIYRRADGKLEIGYRDNQQKQRWQVIDGGVLEARRVRDDLIARRARGERIAPNVRLKFDAAADAWKTGHVDKLGSRTRETYANHLRHLRQRFGPERLDRISPDDVAAMIADVRAAGGSEWSAQARLSVLNSVFRHATRRQGWHGTNPVGELLSSERPKVSSSKRRTIFSEAQIAQTIDAAEEPFTTLFKVAARTGARVSEILGLVWADIRLEDLDDAVLSFAYQVARDGVTRTPTKTDASSRIVPIDRALADDLASFKLARALDGYDTSSAAFAFSTRTGKAINQRNVGRELRAAQKAAKLPNGRPSFPALHETIPGPDGEPVPAPVPRGAVPSMHSFRHSYVSYALHHGQDLGEVALDVGHSSTRVTEQVYRHVIDDAKRRTAKRAQMAARHGSILEAQDATTDGTVARESA